MSRIHKNIRLTGLGQKQIHEAAATLKDKYGFKPENIRAIYTSPLLRTRQTAEILAKDLGFDAAKIIVDDRLRENGMGRLEGHSEDDADRLAAKDANFISQAKKLYGGETESEVVSRLKDFLAATKASATGN